MFVGHFGVGMALKPTAPRVSLGTLVVELGIFALGIWPYTRSTVASDRIGFVGLWALLGLLMLIYFGNLFGPPPPSVASIAWAGQAQWLLILWAYWVDNHRQPKRAQATQGCSPADSHGNE